MLFVKAAHLVQDAQKHGYAVPALNTNGSNYDIARAALEASQTMRSPLIIQVYEGNVGYRGYDYFVHLIHFLSDELGITIPVAIQLDHGKSLESVVKAIRAGFTSVMFDASHAPLEENILMTDRITELARAAGVSVEAEVGYVKGNEPKEESQIGRIPIPYKPEVPPEKTDVEEALRFVSQVDVDMLAVSVGTTHGIFQRQEDLDFNLLRQIREAIPTPLVMHGTSGISLEDLTGLARAGMAKINFGEPFRYNYIRYFNELTDISEHQWHSWRIMEGAKARLMADMKELIQALGSEGKAKNLM